MARTLITAEQIAAWIGVPVEWVMNLTREECRVEDRIPYVQVRGKIMFDADEVVAWRICLERELYRSGRTPRKGVWWGDYDMRPLPPGTPLEQEHSQSTEDRLRAIDEAGVMSREARERVAAELEPVSVETARDSEGGTVKSEKAGPVNESAEAKVIRRRQNNKTARNMLLRVIREKGLSDLDELTENCSQHLTQRNDLNRGTITRLPDQTAASDTVRDTLNKNGRTSPVLTLKVPERDTHVTDSEWDDLKCFFALGYRRRQESREILNAILWRLRSGREWHELPDRYPPSEICKRRFEQWKRDGRMAVISRVLGDPAVPTFTRPRHEAQGKQEAAPVSTPTPTPTPTTTPTPAPTTSPAKKEEPRTSAPKTIPTTVPAKTARRRRQRGCIVTHRDSWALRWREYVVEDGVKTRKLRFKTLGDVTAEHKRNRNPKTGKLRIPEEIQRAADLILEAARIADASSRPISYLLTINELVECHYLPAIQPHRKLSTITGYRRDIWEAHLKARIGDRIVRDFKRYDAFQLWEQIARDKEGISRQTLTLIRFFVSGVFKWALNRGMYDGLNPAEADLPEGLRCPRKTEAYSVGEVIAMLALFGPKVQAIIAAAFGAGLRKGELEGLDWGDYEVLPDGSAWIHVRRSCWNGIISTPKTDASLDAVKLAPEFCSYIDAFRSICGGPMTGFMFGKDGKPINLSDLARFHIRAVLNTCTVCSKSEAAHLVEDHEFLRDETKPKWLGWHAFRRGNATYLAKQFGRGGDGIEAAALMLRHANSSVTNRHYNLNPTKKQDARIAEASKEIEIEEKKKRAADALGEGLRIARERDGGSKLIH